MNLSFTVILTLSFLLAHSFLLFYHFFFSSYLFSFILSLLLYLFFSSFSVVNLVQYSSSRVAHFFHSIMPPSFYFFWNLDCTDWLHRIPDECLPPKSTDFIPAKHIIFPSYEISYLDIDNCLLSLQKIPMPMSQKIFNMVNKGMNKKLNIINNYQYLNTKFRMTEILYVLQE